MVTSVSPSAGSPRRSISPGNQHNKKKKKTIFSTCVRTSFYITRYLFCDKCVYNISWILEYDPFFLSQVLLHTSATIVRVCLDFLWSCEVLRYWRTKTIQKLHRLCRKVILSVTIFLFFFVSSSALMLFREEIFFFLSEKGWMSYNTKYMVASVWLPAPPVLL